MRSVLLILANIGFVLSELVLAPCNMVVVQGSVMKMYCVLKNGSSVRKWDIFKTNIESATLYSPGKIHPRFSHFGVEVDENGSGALYTNSTKLSDAGIYKCFSTIDGEYKEHSAQLTVLESMPTCEENFTLNSLNSSKFLLNGDYIWIQCSVSFRGFWTPTLEWIEYGRHLGPEEKRIAEGVEVTRIPNSSVTSNLTIAANSLRSGSWFACKIYFSKYDGKYTMTAGNVPNFTYIWNSSMKKLSLSSSESVPTTQDADWYLVSMPLVAVLSLFFILMLALAVCHKKKVSASAMSLSNIPDVANANGQQEDPSFPLYTEVPCSIERAIVKSEQRTPGSSMSESHDAKNSRPLNYFGADGTEYMEVNAMGRQPMPVRLPAEPNMFSVVGEYASIDHTLSPPIPPRGRNA